ncbi:MAG: hypothetical protein II838_14420 [Lachnospiraceae bacterium]|jgi:hypothetical protein|nr:hypothetical protein [Lachnospiraceae bacterium]
MKFPDGIKLYGVAWSCCLSFVGFVAGKSLLKSNRRNSCRLYGLRKYKKQINEDKEIEEEISNRNTANTTTEELIF